MEVLINWKAKYNEKEQKNTPHDASNRNDRCIAWSCMFLKNMFWIWIAKGTKK